jgi:hypothetical protein
MEMIEKEVKRPNNENEGKSVKKTKFQMFTEEMETSF